MATEGSRQIRDKRKSTSGGKLWFMGREGMRFGAMPGWLPFAVRDSGRMENRDGGR